MVTDLRFGAEGIGAFNCSLGLVEGGRVGAQALITKLKIHNAIKILVFKMLSLKL